MAMQLVNHVFQTTSQYIEQMPKTSRKKYGQFFTSPETAVFMAGLLTIPSKKKVSICDPGAGSGILTAALVERLESDLNVEDIEVICYENDPNVLELLHLNMKWLCEHCSKSISYQIKEENYILHNEKSYNKTLEDDPYSMQYDLIIGNPPYMKISKSAPEAQAMENVCHGAPNLYFLFATMSLFQLRENGEMAYIIPRSWTSGAYFKKFRQKFLKEGWFFGTYAFVCESR